MTLNQIRSHRPCEEGWAKLLKFLGKTQADDEPLSLLTILQSNGLDDALWALRTESTPKRIQRFALAVARRVEHLSPKAKAVNDITERYLNGTANKAELDAVASVASAAYSAAYAAANAARAAYLAARAASAASAAEAADAAARAASAAADAAYAARAAYLAARAASAAEAADAAARAADAARAAYLAAKAVHLAAHSADAAERKAQVQIFKEIFA